MAAAASSDISESTTKFKTALESEQLTLELVKGELVIELANAPRFEVYKKVISKVDEIREITGNLR